MTKTMNPKMKSRYIAMALKQKIQSQKLAPGTPLPSAHDLAQRYHVCMMTANRALDILEKESIILRKKGCGNFVQKNIIQGRRLLLGIADTIEHTEDYARHVLIDVFPKAASACFKAENCDYRLIPYSVFRDHDADAIADLDGILLSCTYIDEITEKFICNLKIPIVIYRSEYELDYPFPQVIPDHAVVMKQLFEFAGEDKIPGIMIFCNTHPNGVARAQAFEHYAKKYGFTKQQVRTVQFSPLELRQSLLPLMPEIPGKLLITCSGLMTCEIIQLCKENGYVCGRDYFLVSYDNLGKSLQVPAILPEVTSIDYSRTAAAKTAARLLIHTIRNPHSIGCQTIKFPTQLIIKKSAFENRKEKIQK